MIPFIAVPLIHSSGAWIASTAAGGYLTGTLSSTWIGAFVLGNASLLSGLGLVSAGGIFTAASSGIASSLGIAPTVFLGLTTVGWTIASGTTLAVGGLAFYLKINVMKRINEERVKGGLPEIGVLELISEIKKHEHDSKLEILVKLSKERLNFKVRAENDEVIINGDRFSISSIRYVIEENGREFLELVNKIMPNKEIFEINKERTA